MASDADSNTTAEGPPAGSAEAVALRYLTTCDLEAKQTPLPRDLAWSGWRLPADVELRPGRPAALKVVAKAPKRPSAGALQRVEARTQLIHTFWHHELQAAELFCWAALRFPDTPEDFRRGLLALARDEIRHMGLYRDYLAAHGVAIGDHPVRDWFWERIPRCTTPRAFVATLGIGFEGGTSITRDASPRSSAPTVTRPERRCRRKWGERRSRTCGSAGAGSTTLVREVLRLGPPPCRRRCHRS